MEEETPSPDDEISQIRDFEDIVVAMAATTEEPFDSEPHKQQVGQGIDNLGGVDGRIVVLSKGKLVSPGEQGIERTASRIRTSSHQFKVDVTGFQYPSLVGGYGIEGRKVMSVQEVSAGGDVWIR